MKLKSTNMLVAGLLIFVAAASRIVLPDTLPNAEVANGWLPGRQYVPFQYKMLFVIGATVVVLTSANLSMLSVLNTIEYR